MQTLNRILLTVPLLVLTTDQVHADQTGSMHPEWKQASNGVLIEQIAPPIGDWSVSYNRLDRFNVDSQGLIINNAKADYNSQLGGLIHGNPRLQQSAKLILNEVTGTEPSSLRGPIEIAGDKADLIISNPNGLVINGTRFINIGRMTLTAAPPRDRDDILRVAPSGTNDADITIEGDGLDATGADSVDLYAQALYLNAKLYAHALSLRLGSQDIDYPSGKASPNEEVNLHQVLLDSSELGGMYADRINLVGSGVGLGVKLPSEVQVGGNFQISVEGEIQFLDTENLAIGGDLMLQASSMDLPQLVKVGGNAQLTAKGDLRIHKMKVGENSGDGDLRLEAGELYNDNEVSVTGDIELQIEHRWHYNEGGTLRAPRGGVRITTSADRIRLPKKTRSDDCGFYCEDVKTVIADIMRRTDADAIRPDYFRADSGTLVIENLQTLKNISADNSSGGVQMIPRVADNTQPDLVVVTTQVTEQYRNQPKPVGFGVWGISTRDFKAKTGIEFTRRRQDYRYDQLWELPKFPPDPPGKKWTLENIFKSWFGW